MNILQAHIVFTCDIVIKFQTLIWIRGKFRAQIAKNFLILVDSITEVLLAIANLKKADRLE